MTEDEAKTKWCPFGRASDPGYLAYNRNAFGQASTLSLCLGSACMAWRRTKKITNYDHVCPEFDNTEYGYCGLAGKP